MLRSQPKVLTLVTVAVLAIIATVLGSHSRGTFNRDGSSIWVQSYAFGSLAHEIETTSAGTETRSCRVSWATGFVVFSLVIAVGCLYARLIQLAHPERPNRWHLVGIVGIAALAVPISMVWSKYYWGYFYPGPRFQARRVR
jgi:peptidoglycan/LPS O-acetylase OafA/YrhL